MKGRITLGSRPRRISRDSSIARLLGAASLFASLSTGPALAQAGGVVTPPAHVDQGMVRPTPNLPAQSTPVIHPRRLHRNRHGTVQVVPK